MNNLFNNSFLKYHTLMSLPLSHITFYNTHNTFPFLYCCCNEFVHSMYIFACFVDFLNFASRHDSTLN